MKFRQYYKITDSAWGFFLGLMVPQIFFAILLVIISSIAISQGADEETIERWELNFVRHRLTNYDYELSKLKNKVGKEIAYQKYHNILLDKIEEVYPELKDAIGRHGKYIIEDESE